MKELLVSAIECTRR